MRAWILLALAASGCLRSTWYTCTMDSQCGTNGACESNGYCSFPDSTCGRRFGPQAGVYANQCVSAVITDGGLDTPACGGGCDAPNDTPPGSCPSDFVTPNGAPAGHYYKWIANATDWVSQRAACGALGSNVVLGYPSTAGELTAMDSLAGGATYWIGVSDLQTAGTWQTTRNTTQTFLPWTGGTPSGNPNDQCVEIPNAGSMFTNDRCVMTFPAICECE